MDWPARSPDLNPIEHVWDFLGRRLAARTLPPVTIRKLRLALQDEWAAMPQQLIDTLILSMGRRCETCLADEFLDVIYWTRQILGVILGLAWGFIPLQGFIGLALFCLLNIITLYVYTSAFQKIDDEDFGGIWELLKEGFMTSFASFLVTWIMVYSAIHFE
ncbi:respirasome Complex Assembly Factor 1 [Trichonephila clavipes]|nr:respirasome Complex Assembly Factor 1 [Trichonephila clavipes]